MQVAYKSFTIIGGGLSSQTLDRTIDVKCVLDSTAFTLLCNTQRCRIYDIIAASFPIIIYNVNVLVDFCVCFIRCKVFDPLLFCVDSLCLYQPVVSPAVPTCAVFVCPEDYEYVDNYQSIVCDGVACSIPQCCKGPYTHVLLFFLRRHISSSAPHLPSLPHRQKGQKNAI